MNPRAIVSAGAARAQLAARGASDQDSIVEVDLAVEEGGAQELESGACAGEGVELVEQPALFVIRPGRNAQVDREPQLAPARRRPPRPRSARFSA